MTKYKTSKQFKKVLDLRYEPDFVLEFQLKKTDLLQNVLYFDDPLFKRGGTTLHGVREFNYPGLSSKDISNWRLRQLKKLD